MFLAAVIAFVSGMEFTKINIINLVCFRCDFWVKFQTKGQP